MTPPHYADLRTFPRPPDDRSCSEPELDREFEPLLRRLCVSGVDVQVWLIPAAYLGRFEESGHRLFVDERDGLNGELATFAVPQA